MAAGPPRAPGRAQPRARSQPDLRRHRRALGPGPLPEGFVWLDGNDAGRNTFSFVRRAEGAPDLVCVSNFSAVPHHGYRLALPATGQWNEVLNTDAEAYTGSGVGNYGAVTAVEGEHAGQPAHADISVPPLATVWFRRT
nr:alpha amylase C-terminal domain-containing protein [Nocardioides dokdonensis]